MWGLTALLLIHGFKKSLHAWALYGTWIAQVFGMIPSQTLYQLWWIAIALILGMFK